MTRSPPPKSECWRVLHEDVSGSNFANDSPKFPPKPGPDSLQTVTLSGNADVLAWEAPADDKIIADRSEVADESSALFIVGAERRNIIPNWVRIKNAVVLSLGKNPTLVSSNFHGSNAAPPEEFSSE